MRDRRSQKRKITLLVGAGRMGGALLKGWVGQGLGPIAAVEPTPSDSLIALTRQYGVRLFSDIDQVARIPVTACVVALKPQVLRTEAVHLRPVAQSGALMISIAAGTGIAKLRNAWGRGAIIRAMPNMAGAVGKGITALYAPSGVGTMSRMLAECLMRSLGEIIWVNREALIDSVTAVSGSGPAYVFLLAEALAEAGRQLDLPRGVAEQLARVTISGAGALLDADSRPPSALRADVTSPGGTTEAALQVLTQNDALPKLVHQAVAAARTRARKLREQG